MNALQEGQQYALSTKGECNKSLCFVKLTDSAMQSIEMYLSSKGDSSLKPTIHFQENSGTISLPVSGRNQNYGFTLSNIEADGLQSSFQCLQYIHNRSLESLGFMLMKMHIHANEDSYEKTKVKMEAVDKKQKSFCTKEIKSNGTVLSRKFQMKRPGFILSTNKFQPAIKKPEPLTCNLKCKTINNDLLKLSIRKRIIHILAIKPYKKPELLLRLMKEGISEKDKNKFKNILTSIGTLKGDVYNLANHLWNEVQENWEFCTKEELQLIQRRKQQFLKLNSENEIPSSIIQNNSSTLQKLVSSEPVEKEPFAKKRRISHNTSKVSNQIVKNNSSECDNSNKSKRPSVSSNQKLPGVHLQVNGNYNYSSKRNKNSIHNFEKELFSSQKLKKCCNQINNDNHISDSSHDMSSRKQSIYDSDFRPINSNNVQESTINNASSNIENRTFSLPVVNSDSPSKVPEKMLVNSQSEEKDSRRYKCSNTIAFVNNKTSHANSLSVMDKSSIISPVSYSSNSSDSSFSNKDKYNGFDKRNLPLMESILEFEYSDSLQAYNTIESKEQRSQYAKEFNVHYEEYLKLHSQMKEVSLKFTTLEDCLNKCEDGSSEFKKIRARIHEESSSLLNSDYIHAWKKFNILQSKLSHIKKLIKDYDISHMVKS